MNILVRGVPAEHHTRLKVSAAAAGQTLSDYVLQLIAADCGEPPLILGRWQGVVSEVEECADCGQPLAGAAWFGADSAGRVFGPVCEHCATDD